MKISELKLNQEVMIENRAYLYKGVQKLRTSMGKVQKIVFETNMGNRYDYMYLNLPEGKRELSEMNGKLILK